MSTYYQYRDVKVMMAHKLMAMDGWKVYGYHADNSDPMTDYFDPANWGGIAEKNGYILVVDRKWKEEREEIREYNNTSCDSSVMKKIAKLSEMTVERGASEAEEKTAKEMIEKLTKKNNELAEKYVVTGYIPGHMENPPRCNWHIEKDGVIIAKGTGLLKYADIYNYYSYPQYTEDLKDYRTKTKEQYIDDLTRSYMCRSYYDDEKKAKELAISHYDEMKKNVAMVDKFEKFINKIDTTCGGLLGDDDGVIYEKIKVTEYKKELKPVETATGSIKDGQLFILKTDFNYNRYKGLVYRIHKTEYNGECFYHAYKLNGKYTKECHGQANANNHWSIGTGVHDNLTKWIEKGCIAWCELKEVKTPYEVEKVVKKVVKTDKAESNKEPKQETTVNKNDLHYEVSEDTDTRTGEKIYLVKVTETLSREEYININKYIKSIGGYYSRFKHAFLFKENPTDKLNNVSVQETPEPEIEATEEATEAETKETSVEYEIVEDVHTKTGKQIWIVKPKTELNKADFADVKRKLAILQGFYSTFKHGFIFNYNPTEKLQPV